MEYPMACQSSNWSSFGEESTAKRIGEKQLVVLLGGFQPVSSFWQELLLRCLHNYKTCNFCQALMLSGGQ
uniref:Uncharacterized protein n=1 Tax=Arundo donax TaxID=35708 RepID=A0A0A9ABF3_ARUDO